MVCAWKNNWAETRRHFIDWWNHEGLILNTGATPAAGGSRAGLVPSPVPESVAKRYTDVELRAARLHYDLSCRDYPADTVPIFRPDIGPGSLALLLGSEPGFDENTVWFEPHEGPETDPETDPERDAGYAFDPENRWWKIHEATLRLGRELSRSSEGDAYFVGCPDLVENFDIQAALRGPERALMDMIEYPEWTERKMAQINRVWFDVYDRIYEIIRDAEGGAAFAAFDIWGPGKTAKVQCDACAMFSPAMFDRFVLPALREQCNRLDYSMYHLDGHQCLPHLDSLLSIDSLDAVEWTPDPRVPRGGDPRWYTLYRRILDAGKSVQAIQIEADQVVPLLDAVGGAGMYIMTRADSPAEAESLYRKVEQFR